MFTIEANTDSNTNIILNTIPCFFIRIFFLSHTTVCFTLNNKATTTSWDKTLENLSKLPRYLLECSLNGFILTLIKDFNEFLNWWLGIIEFLPTFSQTITLSCELIVLFECLLVNVFILLESFLNLFESRLNLKMLVYRTKNLSWKFAYRFWIIILILFKCFIGQDTQVANVLGAICSTSGKDGLSSNTLLHPLLVLLD